jgi:steroid delta-isomerase-like uncharacterized protein
VTGRRAQLRQKLVETHLVAENAGDIEAVVATFAKPRFEAISSCEAFEGADAVRHHYQERKKAFPDAMVDVTRWHFAENAVIVEIRIQGTHIGVTPDGRPSNGRPYDVPAIAVFEFEGHDLVCERSYFDRNTLIGQITASGDATA